MPIFYNIEPFKADLHAVQGDKIIYSFNVTVNDIAFDMTPYIAEMHVRRKDGLAVKKWTSDGGTPDIVITVDVLDFYTDGFLDSGNYDYDLQIIDPVIGGILLTLMWGQLFVQKEYTK